MLQQSINIYAIERMPKNQYEKIQLNLKNG